MWEGVEEGSGGDWRRKNGVWGGGGTCHFYILIVGV